MPAVASAPAPRSCGSAARARSARRRSRPPSPWIGAAIEVTSGSTELRRTTKPSGPVSPSSAAPSAVSRTRDGAAGPAGDAHELGTGVLAQVEHAAVVERDPDVRRLLGLPGERRQMRSGELVERVLAHRGDGELAQPRPRAEAAVGRAGQEAVQLERREQPRGGARRQVGLLGELGERQPVGRRVAAASSSSSARSTVRVAGAAASPGRSAPRGTAAMYHLMAVLFTGRYPVARPSGSTVTATSARRRVA